MEKIIAIIVILVPIFLLILWDFLVLNIFRPICKLFNTEEMCKNLVSSPLDILPLENRFWVYAVYAIIIIAIFITITLIEFWNGGSTGTYE